VIGSLRLSGGAHARRKRWHLAGALSTAVLSLLVAALVGLLAATLLGYRAFTIKSGSMTPAIAVGEVVVDTSVSPLAVHPGEIITFRDPALGQQLVTHRVVSMHRSGGRVLFVTKGDANVVTEHWNVLTSGHVGRELLVVPQLGRVLADVSSPGARVLEVALFALCIACIGIRWIWRQPAVSVSNQTY